MRAPGQAETVTADDLARVLPIAGYLNRISARPAQTLEAKVSAQGQDPYTASVVRIVSGDPNPEGPGLIYVPQTFGAGTYPPRSQPIDRGSYARIPQDSVFAEPTCLFSASVQPWLLRATPSVIVSAQTPDGVGWWLDATATTLAFHYQSPGGAPQTVSLQHVLKLRHWVRIWAGYDRRTHRLVLGTCPFKGGNAAVSESFATLLPLTGSLPVTLAARTSGEVSDSHFNGRIEDPCVFTELPVADATPPDPRNDPPMALAAWWDFADGIDTACVTDRGALGLAGRLVNMPTRAVRGTRWDGAHMDWRGAPEHYAAIHFHEDDLSDCRWKTDFELTIPADTPSGVYGLRLQQGTATDILPFYVLPARTAEKAAICFLASTLTHQAYANHARGNTDEAFLSTIWSKASDFSRKNIQTCAEGAHEPLNPLTLVGGGSVEDRAHQAYAGPS